MTTSNEEREKFFDTLTDDMYLENLYQGIKNKGLSFKELFDIVAKDKLNSSHSKYPFKSLSNYKTEF